jgi:hypothetical protein
MSLMPSVRIHRLAQGSRDDRGLVLAIAALVLTGLLVMSAMAVDLCAVYNERRQDQSAADAAALAAAQDLPSVSTAVATAKSVAATNLGEPVTAAQWDSCTDGSAFPVPSGYTKVSGSSCIAFNSAVRRIFVRLPVRQYDAAFAGIVGLDEFEHSAFAVAGVETEGFGGVLPFALAAGSGSFTCVERGGGNVAGNDDNADCKQGSAQPGNFGALDFSFYGNESVGTTQSCSTQQTQQIFRFTNNVAVGVDHGLTTIGSDPRYRDTAQCGTLGPTPNSAGGNTGSSVDSSVGAGLWSGGTFSDGAGPRLTRLGITGTPAWMTAETNIGGVMLDDIPLWHFLPPVASQTPSWDVPRSCWSDQFTAASSPTLAGHSLPSGVAGVLMGETEKDRILMLTTRCLMHYQGEPWDADGALTTVDPPCTASANPTGKTGCATSPSSFTDPIFTRDSDPNDLLYDIQYTPRFAYVPETTDPQGNAIPADIITFKAVYIQRLFGGCSGGGNCRLLFDPGVGYSLPSPHPSVGDNIQAVGVFQFPRGSLPGGLAEESAPFALNANRFVELVR